MENGNGNKFKQINNDNGGKYVNNKIKSIFLSIIRSREKLLLDILNKITLLKGRPKLYRNDTLYDTI